MQPEFPTVPGQPYQPQYPQYQQHPTASQMKKPKGLRIAVVLLSLALIAALSFGIWAASEAAKYKGNIDDRVANGVGAAVKKAEDAKEADFLEREKRPLRAYTGPSAFGTVGVKYPKTWSAYVDESGKGSNPLTAIFHPRYVPGLLSETAFALKVEVIGVEYSTELKRFDSASKSGDVRVSPLKASNGVSGVRITGKIDNDRSGAVVLFPLRDKTLKLTTLSNDFIKDFNDIILKNLTFTP